MELINLVFHCNFLRTVVLCTTLFSSLERGIEYEVSQNISQAVLGFIHFIRLDVYVIENMKKNNYRNQDDDKTLIYSPRLFLRNLPVNNELQLGVVFRAAMKLTTRVSEMLCSILLSWSTIQHLRILLARSGRYYLPTPPLGQDMTQGRFLSGV